VPNGVNQRSWSTETYLEEGFFLGENKQISDQISKYAILLAKKTNDIARRDDGAIVILQWITVDSRKLERYNIYQSNIQ